MDLEIIIPAVVVIVAAVLAIAKAVVGLTKSEKDDEVVGKIERVVAPILRALGRKGEPKRPAGDE